MSANDTQIGGDHYQTEGEQHWDRAWKLGYDCFQYIITKWVERWRDKGGIEDLYKARHALNKYIECVEAQEREGKHIDYVHISQHMKVVEELAELRDQLGEEPGPDYVDQW